MEKYNKYIESLNIDCECNSNKSKVKANESSKCCCNGLESHDNALEILIRQLKREVAELLKTTQATLLCQDKKIAQLENYVKNNLSNYLRELLDSMLVSGELDEIIKEVITNSIEVLENDVAKLREDVDLNKTHIDSINNNIIDLKANKLEFEEYEESTIYDKFQNIDVDTDYTNNSIIYITKLKNIEKLAVLPTNGDKSEDINVNKKNVKEYAQSNSEYDVYINGGMNGIYIFDGTVNQTTRLDCPYYCGFTENNDMKFYEGLSQAITPDTLIADRIVNCFSGFAPLIVDHELADYTSINNIVGSNEIARAFIDSLPVKHPRQILAQDDDNNFYIISIMGRFNNSQGFNYDEMKNYCLSKGFKNAFNVDGGGSMQTIVNKNYVFYPSQELDTNIDRLIPSVVAFKLKGVE